MALLALAVGEPADGEEIRTVEEPDAVSQIQTPTATSDESANSPVRRSGWRATAFRTVRNEILPVAFLAVSGAM